MKFIEGNYFHLNGKKQYLMGINYLSSEWGHKSGWWQHMDLGTVSQDMDLMKGIGLAAFRLPLPFNLMPKAGKVDGRILKHVDAIVALAKQKGLTVILNLFMTGRLEETDWLRREGAYTDPKTLRYELQCVRALVDRYRGEDTVIAYDICNEPWWMFGFPPPDPGGRGRPGRKTCTAWMKKFIDGARALKPGKPLTLGIDHAGVVFDVGGDVDALEGMIDVMTTHGYSRYVLGGINVDEVNSLRDTYYCSFVHRRSVIRNIPSGCMEFGNSSQYMGEEELAAHYRVTLYSLLLNGSTSFFPWNFIDFAPSAFDHYPYNQHEITFGAFRSDRTPKPHARELARFSAMLKQLDPERWSLPLPDAAVYVPDNYYDEVKQNGPLLFNAYCLAKQAGLNTGFIRRCDDWKGLKLIVCPTTQLTLPEMDRLRNWVREGGVLSLSASAYYHNSHYLADCLGVRVQEVDVIHGPVRVSAPRSWRQLRKGEAMTFDGLHGQFRVKARATTADVIMTDAQGRPAVTCKRFGRGHVLHTLFPFEQAMAATPGSPRTVPAWKLYASLKELAGIRYEVEADHPYLERGVLSGRDSVIAVFINHELTAVTAPVRTTFKPSKVVDLMTGKTLSAVRSVRLGPSQVQVLKFYRSRLAADQ